MIQMTEEQKDKIVAEFIESIDKDFRTYMMLVQFMSIKMGQKAIDMNARELSVEQEVEYNGKRYFIRTATQFTEHGEATLEDRAEEIVERMMEQPNKSSERQEEYDLRTLLKDAVMAGYNLHRQDDDDEEGEEDDDDEAKINKCMIKKEEAATKAADEHPEWSREEMFNVGADRQCRQSPWTTFEEQMPDERVGLLLLTEGCQVFHCYLADGYIFFPTGENISLNDIGFTIEHGNPLAWMYLPELSSNIERRIDEYYDEKNKSEAVVVGDKIYWLDMKGRKERIGLFLMPDELPRGFRNEDEKVVNVNDLPEGFEFIMHNGKRYARRITPPDAENTPKESDTPESIE